MRQNTACFVSAVAAVVVSGAVVSSQSLPTPILADDPAIQASLARIEQGSALWRAEVDAIRPTGRRVLVLTPEAVLDIDPQSLVTERFDRRQIADVSVIASDDHDIAAVLVVVNLTLLHRVHTRRGTRPSQRDADLDRILIHEVYGHALPYLLAGSLAGRCPDPVRFQRPTDACSIRRENAVRAQLNLGRRSDYGLDGLALAHTSRWPWQQDR